MLKNLQEEMNILNEEMENFQKGMEILRKELNGNFCY